MKDPLDPRPSQARGGPLRGGSGVLLLRGASTDAVDWRAFELAGVQLDLVQAVQVARAHGALVVD